MLFATLLLLGFRPSKPDHYSIGHGLVAVVSRDPTAAYATQIDIRRGRTLISHLRTRSLIESWLASDRFWGGAKTADEFRHLDHPTPESYADLQGTICEVVPAPGGCLLRMEMVYLPPSLQASAQDFILWWRETKPSKWPVYKLIQGGESAANPSMDLPRYRGIQYLVKPTALYRLTGPNLALKLVAKLPSVKGASWLGMFKAGRKLLLDGINGEENHVYAEVDLVSGKFKSLSSPELKKEFGFRHP